MIKQLIIFSAVIIVYMAVPDFAGGIWAIKNGQFVSSFLFTTILIAYSGGLIIESLSYLSLKKLIEIKPVFRFIGQLTISIFLSLFMKFYYIALMSV
ncbi:MAG: hypothetical protein ACTH5M_04005 [Psychrobacter sp.]|uniref:hypothetical protein n=1 Tax=Psychrobacter sp. AOP7-B1-24 TaxID=3457645 RepID=UPI003FB6D1A7